MVRSLITITLLLFLSVSSATFCQTLDGNPYKPRVDPDIDMFMNTWENSEPRTIRGSLVEQDVLTKGDPVKPSSKGGVLKYVNRYVHAELPSDASTDKVTLKNEQEVYYIVSGSGKLSAKSEDVDLYSGIFVLVPEGMPFKISNTGDNPLTMYIIADPVYDGFKPNKKLVVKDENKLPITGSNGHWAHIVKRPIEKPDGLATIKSVLTVRNDPMTIGRPHSHDPGCEEVWTALHGTSILFLGKMIRMQPPGTAYNIPPDSNTPHCNINTSGEQVKFLYFSVRKDLE